MELTFAQALTEAKQVIVQQATRIKADAEKIRVQHDMLVTQGQNISDQEKCIKEQAAEIDRLNAEIASLNQRLTETIEAKDQAEAIINRQGEKITTVQSQNADLERTVAEQSEQIHSLSRERETLIEKLPTKEDADALAAMSALLMKKATAASSSQSSQSTRTTAPTMRLAEAA